MLSKLGSHPHTLLLLAGNVCPPSYFFVTEKMMPGNLFRILHDSEDQNYGILKSRGAVVGVIKQIHEGLRHVHHVGIIHRDIKSLNILIRHYTPNIEVVIGDFGTATFLKEGEYVKNYRYPVGTPMYMAPEIWRLEPYSQDADIYSFGILAYEIFFQKVPYEDFPKTSDEKSITRDAMRRGVDDDDNGVSGDGDKRGDGAMDGGDFNNIFTSIIEGKLRPKIPEETRETNFTQILQRCWSDKGLVKKGEGSEMYGTGDGKIENQCDNERPTHCEIQEVLENL
eukprot:TRINITY_DN7433_c0_g4_i3.p1 TRINITY_DN7433_c0_g4~~TRINITY_DN7433_c0_g4_i3.p1  ORF type:complete len:282 (+),score=60.95 TRINITY_DN7433_c0_g4_i3:514-1359(+)